MSRKLQVKRNGAVIGQHDEQTLFALLNAGALRLSDTYWHRGMRTPRSLAEFLGRGTPRERFMRRLQPVVLLLATAMVMGAVWLFISAKRPGRERVVLEAPAAVDDLAGYEIRRGEAVMVGGFDLRLADEPPFPEAVVGKLAEHSRVSVLAFDDRGQPSGVSAGFAMESGDRVACALEALGGASSVEVRLPDGRTLRPEQVIADRDSGVAVLMLEQAAMPLRMATEPLAENERVLLADHALSMRRGGRVVRVLETLAGEKLVRYQLDERLPASASGSALLNAAGDVAALVVDAERGMALRAADVLKVMQTCKPQRLAVLKAGDAPVAAGTPVKVFDATVSDGALIASLRNTGASPVHGALLHVTYYHTPPEAAEAKNLEIRLRALAVQASLLEDEGSDEARVNRQALREVNEKLESVQKRLAAAVTAASRHPQRRDLHVVQCELPPGIPQTVQLDVEAGSQWSASVIVLEVDS